MKPIWAALALLGLAGCAQPVAQALYGPDSCRRVALIDAANGQPILGGEDGAFEARSGMVFVSAYDRLAVERATKSASAPAPLSGGVYAIAASQLRQSSLRVSDVLGPVLPENARPHGIDTLALEDGKVRLAAVNRAFLQDRDSGAWRMRPELEIIEISDEGISLVSRILSPSLCRANDVAFTDPQALRVTLDRGICLGDGHPAVGGPALAKVSIDGAVTTQASPVAFPNGIAQIDEDLWIASTLQGQLAHVQGARRVQMPGAPDNFTQDGKGRLIIALHPQIWRFALHRLGWPGFAKAPSRIVRYDPKRRSIAILFDDPDGKIFSGASFGLMAEGQLVLGAIREPGLLVCTQGEQPA